MMQGADISPHFNAVYEFIANAERLKQREQAVLHGSCMLCLHVNVTM
jgi:hypothetical protein